MVRVLFIMIDWWLLLHVLLSNHVWKNITGSHTFIVSNMYCIHRLVVTCLLRCPEAQQTVTSNYFLTKPFQLCRVQRWAERVSNYTALIPAGASRSQVCDWPVCRFWLQLHCEWSWFFKQIICSIFRTNEKSEEIATASRSKFKTRFVSCRLQA